MTRLDLFKPTLGAAELAAVKEVFESGWIGYGPRCEGAEKSWAFVIGAKYGVATNSCTSALQVALKLLHVGPGDEVIVPTITFAATAEAVVAVGAQPVFCDVQPSNLMIDLESARSMLSPRTKAIIPVLYAGQPLDIGSEFEGVPLVYDCAHAAGASFNAKGKLCCWSFQAVKNLGCGDGGMITMDSEVDQSRAKSLIWHGINRSTWDRSNGKHYTWDYDIQEVGFKGQMNDITAAILSVQIGRMGENQSARRAVAYQYLRRLHGLTVVRTVGDEHLSSWHLFVIKTDQRNQLAEQLAACGIATGVHYRPLHLHTLFANGQRLPVAECEWQQILSLPIHPQLTEQSIELICDSICSFVGYETKVAA